MRTFTWIAVLLTLLVTRAPFALAQEDDEAESKKASRMKIMRDQVGELKIAGESPPTFADSPILRYSDPTRDLSEDIPGTTLLLDASVWRLGTSGRPIGLLTMEIYGTSEKEGALSYEFAALTASESAIQHKGHPTLNWKASAKAFSMRPLADVEPPAKTPAARLNQMRQIIRRFEVVEAFRDTRVNCRLLSKPIDRYESADQGIVDGAIFAFANGTNPEAGVLLECNEKEWSHGTVRLSAAQLQVKLDGELVATYEAGDFRVRQGDYLSFNHPIKLEKR